MSLSLAEATETTLAVPALAPEDEVFESLYRSYFPRLVRVLRRRTGNAALAEDLAQETLLRAYLNIDGIDVTRPLWPWLKTISTRLVIDHARCNGREELCEPQAEGIPDDLERVEDDLIHQAIAKLTGNQKVAISLRYLDDWKPADAATFLGINRIAFEQLLRRARRRLRAEYARLSEKAPAIILLPYRKTRRLLTRFAHHPREAGSSAGPAGAVGVDAAAQLASGVLALLTAAAGVASSLPVGGPRAALASTSRAADVAAGPQESGKARSAEPKDAGTGFGSPAMFPRGAGDGGNQAAEIAKKITDPNDDVKQPEDARITSIAFGPGSGPDQTVYAAGRTLCGARCPSVLFVSEDGGSTWTRLDAEGFEGDILIVPRNHDGQTIFAMGPTGLQVSRDAGRSFTMAALTGATFAVGSAAISPAFHQGDPTVLIGAQTLLRYRDNTTTVEPYPAPLTGPLNPVYSPAYPADPRIFVGGVKIQPQTNEAIATIYTCNGSVCTQVELPGARFAPHIRLSNNFIGKGIALAFDNKHLFLSRDAATSFTDLHAPVGTGTIWDAAYSQGGLLFLATTTTPVGKEGRLLVSKDEGASWEPAVSSLFESGAAAIATSAGRVIVALGDRGLACSTDDGATWGARCS